MPSARSRSALTPPNVPLLSAGLHALNQAMCTNANICNVMFVRFQMRQSN